MRKAWMLLIALAGGAALLVPAGGAAGVGDRSWYSGRINGMSVVNLTITCHGGVAVGAAKGDNTVSVVSPVQRLGPGGAESVEVTTDNGQGSQTLRRPNAPTPLALRFPCTGHATTTVSFQPWKGNGKVAAPATTVTVHLTRAAS